MLGHAIFVFAVGDREDAGGSSQSLATASETTATRKPVWIELVANCGTM